jgi:hypothetical protein
MGYTFCLLFKCNSDMAIVSTRYMTKLNSMALVHERTKPTERPPPVGEVTANFSG